MASGQPTVILTYHRVGAFALDPWGIQVSPERFEQHLRCITEHAQVVPLEDVLERSDRPRVAITFDDGYLDNLENAKPSLERLGLPATVFVTSGMVDDHRGFWWDRLAQLLLADELGVRHLRLRIGETPLTLHVGSPSARERAYRFLHRRLVRLPLSSIDDVLGTLADELDAVPRLPVEALTMTRSELVRLADGATVAIGAHTVTHPMLSTLDPTEQRQELEQSRVALESIVERPVRHLAYPYGSAEAVDDRAVGAARDCYELAVTTLPGSVATSPSRHELHRRDVGDWTADRFAATLCGWLSD